MPGVAAIIVTYNRKEKLHRCIRAVLAQDSELLPDIFIVDNNSSDGTEEEVRKLSSEVPGRIIYENLRHNSGGAGGFCYGVRKAAEAGYDYLWLMDDDCIPHTDALDELMKYDSLHQGEYGFLSSRVLWTDGSLCEMNVQRESVFRDISASKLIVGCPPAEVAMASFVSLFIPVDIVYEVGLPIREFFIWTDDWEYTRRISLRYPCYVIPSSTVVHHTGKNTGADISRAGRHILDRFNYLYRNDVYLYRREGIRGYCYEAARLAWHTVKVLAGGRNKKDVFRRIRIIYRGTMAGFNFNPCIDRAMPSEPREIIKQDDTE